MGIKGLFRSIKAHYPLCSQRLSYAYDNRQVDNLYLDTTNIFIKAISYSGELNKPVQDNDECIQNAFFQIDSLVHLLQPKNTLFISLEGPSPMVAVWKWRQRSYQKRNSKTSVLKEEPELSRPLEPKIRELIAMKLQTDDTWKAIKNVFIAGTYCPNEAELKIFSYIKHMREQPGYDPNQTHWIYTQDSDLIPMSLLSHEPHITLVSEYKDPFSKVPFSCIHSSRLQLTRTTLETFDISLLREYLFLEFQSTNERIFDDISFLLFIFGCEIHPPFPEFDRYRFSNVIENYKTLFSKNMFIIDRTTINWANFSYFLEISLPSPEIQENIRKEYEERNVSKEETEKLCKEIMDCFAWTFLLYKKASTPSWSFNYSTYFVPPLKDVIEFIRNSKYDPSFPDPGEPLSILENLYLYITDTSKVLPPKVYETKTNSKLMEYYNPPHDKVELDKNGLYKLPSVDISELRKELEPFIDYVAEESPLLLKKEGAVELKTNKEYNLDSETFFQSKNMSEKRPFGTPSFISGPFENMDLLQTFELKYEKDTRVLKIKSGIKLPKCQFNPNDSVASLWPYEQVFQVVKARQYVDETQLTRLEKCIEFTEEEPIHLIPIDPNTGLCCGSEILFSPTFCVPAPKTKKPQSITFECFFPNLKSSSYSFKPISEISAKAGLTDAEAENILSGMLLTQQGSRFFDSFGLQLHIDRCMVPFFVKKQHNTWLYSDEVIFYLKQYMTVLGDKSLIGKNVELSDEKAIQLAKYLDVVKRDIPFFASDKTDSMPASDVLLLEEKVMFSEKLPKPATVTQSFQHSIKVGNVVAIVNDRTVAPKGSTGIVVASDPISQEVWLLMHTFDCGISFNGTIYSYRGLIVNNKDIVPFKGGLPYPPLVLQKNVEEK